MVVVLCQMLDGPSSKIFDGIKSCCVDYVSEELIRRWNGGWMSMSGWEIMVGGLRWLGVVAFATITVFRGSI